MDWQNAFRHEGLTRREFVKSALAAGIALGAALNPWAQAQGTGSSTGSASTPEQPDMPYRILGRTGVRISAIGLGGYHIGIPDEQEGIRIIRTAIDHGITFMDNCWDYHDGGSEIRMGKALRDGYRQKVFLMSKRTFQPLSRKTVSALLARTAQPAATGQFEPFKTSSQFDGTAHNPQWLG